MFAVITPEVNSLSLAGLEKLQASGLEGSCLVFNSEIIQQYPHLEALITQEERERGGRFMFDKDRQTYVAAHAVLRQVLKAFGGDELSSQEFSRGDFGKPYLPVGARLNFSLSHSRDRIALAFDRNQELGIDVEWHNPEIDVQEVGSRVYSASEMDYISAGGSDSAARFYQLWTRKEALIKKAGFGLSTPIDLRGINVLEQVPTLEHLPDVAPEWMRETHIATYEVPEFGLFSLATEHPGKDLKCYNLE
ncbi:4'-phosphopantetheinyl transferase superfamily protein [Robiginitalea myxolifaciens]|uniref:4'-phosphopantetheinyl transferase superfamily protein n=1 Tax=Robiginitalea myxolifaciens TaxID=400055 RepID=A0A1I6FXW5_9FLAO|nr:4'-phosphopantetheinyl transferase superfamily protein [Robiginitalea myxolifaciens]SFR34740.1 4'-phosphopantetheinyl transferase superfamily protein [Robiginitalea myxolifaciens]